MLPKYDTVIKSAPKDYIKLKYVINSLKHLNPQPEKIYIISPDGYLPTGTNYDDKLISVKDADVFPGCDRDRLKHRKNWVYQNFMSVFQNVTQENFYLDVQSDNFFVNDVNLFENGKPVFFISPQHSHYHQPYFTYSKTMFDLDRLSSDSFIIEFMMYNRTITKEMLSKHQSFNNLYDKSCEIISPTCYMADQELYGNWCVKHHPDLYLIRENIKTKLLGKHYPNNYSEQEIIEIIHKNDYEEVAISLHTWGDEEFNRSKGKK
jgi:hypothetical protein